MRNSPAGSRRQTALYRLRAWIIRHRRFLAAAFLAAAASLTVYQLTPEPAERRSVVVAAAELPAGVTLDRGHLAVLQVPLQAVPAGSYQELKGLLGRQLATPLHRGQLLNETSLAGPGLLAGTPAGTTAVPVRMSDPSSLRILSPGQLIDVVLSPDPGPGSGPPGTPGAQNAQVLAARVSVLWIGRGEKSDSWLGAADSPGLVVVAAAPAQAGALAGVRGRGGLSFVLVR